MLTEKERVRYDRQIMMPEIGEEGQERLKEARVVIAGVGGLGSPAALYLAAAGVGTLRIIDRDVVERSNLNRQILHWEGDLGRKKIDSALEKLTSLNPHVKVEALGETIDEENAGRLVEGFDLIVDAMDNLPTRYILNKVAVEKKIPFFHGAVRGLEGRATTIIPGETACLRCMYRGPVPREKFPVIGVAPAVIGAIQASEVVKYIVGAGRLLTGRMLLYDGIEQVFKEFKTKRNPQCDHCGEL
ncbi:MAG: HesA/MoeB/ThiF family protein [Deltaproteobacteria bacterium]|nr:HesA/MoeB/ThiF family protein [Deltaproteobacteria bacterium]MBW2129988.1 HesA/MoeB/ThiF family protein [Deltaproteobacteria bacterium]MBW2304629.1 HesA/MoeB/ThiF family protein [Deltaproteobacteria bacterium]